MENTDQPLSFRSRVWQFIKKHGPAFLVGVGVGAGVTAVAVKTSTSEKSNQVEEMTDNVVSLQEQIG